MKKNDVDYLLEKQNISARYIQPLLNELNTRSFAQAEIIQVLDTLVKLANGVYFLIETTNALPNIFKNRTLNRFIKVLNDQCVLLSTEDLKLNNLRDIFLECAAIYPNANFMMRTMIQELFFEAIMPLPSGLPIVLNTAVVCFKEHNGRSFPGGSYLDHLPPEILLYINQFFDDPGTIKNYRQVCRKTYALQKAEQDQRANIFFTVGEPISLLHHRDPGDKELRAGVKWSKAQSLRLFASLSDAVAYAHSLEKVIRATLGRGVLFHHQDVGRFIPSIITVSYIGSANKLEFQDEFLSRQQTYIAYAMAPLQAVLPLSAVVFLPISNENNLPQHRTPYLQNLRIGDAPELMDSRFLHYRVVRQFNYLDPSRNHLFRCLKILDNKYEDLALRGFDHECDKLQLLKEKIELKTQVLEKKLTRFDSSHYAEIRKFKIDSYQLFLQCKESLNQHRGYHHLIAEFLLVLLTLGFYSLAMITNKHTNNQYTFFSTDTRKKLVRAEQEVNDYVDVLSMHRAPL